MGLVHRLDLHPLRSVTHPPAPSLGRVVSSLSLEDHYVPLPPSVPPPLPPLCDLPQIVPFRSGLLDRRGREGERSLGEGEGPCLSRYFPEISFIAHLIWRITIGALLILALGSRIVNSVLASAHRGNVVIRELSN